MLLSGRPGGQARCACALDSGARAGDVRTLARAELKLHGRPGRAAHQEHGHPPRSRLEVRGARLAALRVELRATLDSRLFCFCCYPLLWPAMAHNTSDRKRQDRLLGSPLAESGGRPAPICFFPKQV